MSNLHVVYRLDDPGLVTEQWSAYSYPMSIYAGGSTLDEARSEFRAAARFALGDQLHGDDAITVVEHLERPLAPGCYVRTAIDRRTLDRDHVALVMRNSLTVPAQRQDFEERMPLAATGDGIVIACVGEDRLSWIFEQMTDSDSIALCSTGPSLGNQQMLWWSFLVGHKSIAPSGQPTETLEAAGLTADSTISEFTIATDSATGRALLTSIG